MSYDISFWKAGQPIDLSQNEIYKQLSKGRRVKGLAELPGEAIFAKLRETFGPFDEEVSSFETDEYSIEVSRSKCHFRFDIRGDVGEASERLIALMEDFGCSPYDPQCDSGGEHEDDTESTTPLPKAITDLMKSQAEPVAKGTTQEQISFLIERPDDDGPLTICMSPSDSDIESVVKSLPWEDPLTLRLWREDSQYFEVYGSLEARIPDDRLRAYYQEGDTFYASTKVLKTLDEIVAILVFYNRGDDQWRKAVRWKVLRRG